MHEIAVWTVYGWIGLVLVAMLQLVLWVVCALVGKALFKRLLRIYHLTVISYWLGRLERKGVRRFQRPDEDGSVVDDAKT